MHFQFVELRLAGIALAIFFSIGGCAVGEDCTDESPAYRRAISLDDGQLAGLYEAMQSRWTEVSKTYAHPSQEALQADPDFSFLHPEHVRVYPSPVIYLSACSFDRKVVLLFDVRSEDSKEIHLHWGESNRKLIWSRSKMDAQAI